MVRLIRGDECHYLSVSDDILSCIKSDRIMRIGHVTPSVVITLLLAIKVFPLLSVDYAEQLAQNSSSITITVLLTLIPVLLLNGIVIEVVLEWLNEDYKNLKRNDKY